MIKTASKNKAIKKKKKTPEPNKARTRSSSKSDEEEENFQETGLLFCRSLYPVRVPTGGKAESERLKANSPSPITKKKNVTRQPQESQGLAASEDDINAEYPVSHLFS